MVPKIFNTDEFEEAMERVRSDFDENGYEPEECTKDVLSIIASYMVKKTSCNNIGPAATNMFLHNLNDGDIIIPSVPLMAKVYRMEGYFQSLCGYDMDINTGFTKRLMLSASDVDLDVIAKKLFFTCRIYSRLRDLNNKVPTVVRPRLNHHANNKRIRV